MFRAAVRVHVRDQRRPRPAVELGRERRREREDVGDDDLGGELAHERQRVVGGVDDGLVEVERLGALREDLVLGRGRERHPLALDVALPAPPGLQRDLVTARHERAAERDHRKSVAGVAEGAQQDPAAGGHAWPRGAQAASSASRRICSRRSSRPNAVGVIPSVPTPASR